MRANRHVTIILALFMAIGLAGSAAADQVWISADTKGGPADSSPEVMVTSSTASALQLEIAVPVQRRPAEDPGR